MKADAENTSRNYRAPLPMRRTAKQIKHAMPQVLGICPLAPPQGMADQKDICPLSHWKEVRLQ